MRRILNFVIAFSILTACSVMPRVSYAATSGIYTYAVADGTATITDFPKGVSGDIVIPSTVGGYDVTKIGGGAFFACRLLTKITIPNSVLSIDSAAFMGCTSLTSITLPEGLTIIDDLTFEGCTSLTSITLPEGITSIDDDAFSGCTSLANITISEGLTKIGGNAFLGCTSLTSITLPERVTSIGWGAFRDCDSLTSITIPGRVTNIWSYAFEGCENLSDVYYLGAQEDWKKISIGSDNEALENATIHFVANTKTTIFDDGKSFVVTPVNVESGKTVILALYRGTILTDIQKAVFSGNAISFTTDKTYTNAKVMVWESMTDITPVCSAEIVK